MIDPGLLNDLYADSYAQIQASVSDISHQDSIRPPAFGANTIHWILGHVVVSRCNFLMMLGQPSIWPWETCAYFIPGTNPSSAAAGHITFEILRADLGRTQAQLTAALSQDPPPDLAAVHHDQTLAQHLAEYAAHEAFHAGQLELLCQAVIREPGELG